MKFNLNDFLQLDTKALLAVNGGTHCGGETDSSGYASSSGSNSYGARGGGGGSGGGSSGGGSGGGGCSRFDLTPFINNTKKTSQTETSVSTSSGGGSCGGLGNSHSSHGNQIPDYPGFDRSPATSATEKLMQEIVSKGDFICDNVGERTECYKKGSYQCDEYVEEMVRGAGYNPKDYYVDNPHGKNVDTHISELKNSGKSYETNASKLTEGAYVVFMSDNDKKVESHTGLFFVNGDGSAYMYDNSSHNFKNADGTYSGGIQKTGGNGSTAKQVCEQYSSYENFYFQRIN